MSSGEGEGEAACQQLMSKLEVDVEINADAKDFHDVFSCRPHHVSNASPTNIQACDLHDGEWGKPGTLINWNYVHDGKQKSAKEIIEAIDDEKNMTRFKVISGDLMDDYEKFVLEVSAAPKPDGPGSIVHWILEYELKHDQIPHPESMIDFVVEVTKDIDSHLVAANSSTNTNTNTNTTTTVDTTAAAATAATAT